MNRRIRVLQTPALPLGYVALAVKILPCIPLLCKSRWFGSAAGVFALLSYWCYTLIDGASPEYTVLSPQSLKVARFGIETHWFMVSALVVLTGLTLLAPIVVSGAPSAAAQVRPREIAEIRTGPELYGVTLDTVRQRAFVAHAEGVTVIDTSRAAVITTTHSITLAHGIGYDPDRDRIWVARRSPDRVIVLDGAPYATLADLPAGDEPHSVGYDPVNGRIYVTNYGGEIAGTVDVYSAETLTHVRELTGFAEPAHIAVNPTTNKIYVANHRPNRGIIVIDGATYDTHQATTTLLDAYGVTVDVSRNLFYATGIAQGRISVIDGVTDAEIDHMDIHDDGQAVWLRVITANPNAGSEGHLLLVTSSNDGERDQVLLIPNGWPTLGTPVPLDIAIYPQEGIALEPESDRVWVTSVSSGLVSVVQDGEPVCSP